MLRNYLKIAWRNLRSGGWYSLLNIGGLAVVLAVSVLLLWWIKDELSYDRFHADADRIYRINSHFGKGEDERTWTGSPAPIAVAAKSQVPGVENVVRIAGQYDFRTFRVEGKTFAEKAQELAYADENFLDVFSGFRVLYGNPARPFPTPNSVVLTEKMAEKLFGTANAFGKIVVGVDSSRTFTVGAVLADAPDNSSLKFGMYFPMGLAKRSFGGNGDWKVMDEDWGNYYFSTYLKLNPNTDPATVGQKLTQIQAIARKNEAGSDYRLQALTQSHLHAPDGKNSGLQQVQILGAVALLLLSIGCINYVNLTTARATRRAKEVGIRKVVGAESRHLTGQLLVESLLTLGLSLVLAIGLIQGLLPFYRNLTGKLGQFSLLDPQAWAVLLGTLTLTFLLAGIYPALMVAAFNPIRALRGRRTQSGNAGLRRSLVVTQFALATALIIGTIVIGSQLRFIRERDPGFSREHVFSFNGGRFTQQFKRALDNEVSVLSVTTATSNPVGFGNSTGDTDWDGKAPNRMFFITQLGVDKDFIPNFKMKLVAGQNFDGTKADSAHVILNETAIKQAGIQNPIGKRFKLHQTDATIIGVLKDFNFESVRTPVGPLILFSYPEYNGVVQVRTTGQFAPAALAVAGRLWKQYSPEHPFEYSFLDETYNRQYRAEQQTGQLFNFFAGVAILVSCLGLLGLAAFTAEQRTKEIGVRKVLGASVFSIVALLSKDFLKLVAVAIVIASPLAWWAMTKWLENFAYKISIGWWVFALSGLLAVGIALLTVSFQSIRAALMNPVKSLRAE